MRIVAFGSYRLHEQPRVRVLLEGLRAHRHEVFECNVPLAFDTRSRIRTVQQPWRGPALGFRVAQTWPRLWSKARRLPRPDVVLVPYLATFDIHLARRLWPRTPIVLDQFLFLADTASDRGVTSRFTLSVLERLDRGAMRASDLIVVDTEGHRDLVPDALRARAVVVPVGAPHEWFHEPAGRVSGPLRVIFFGIFTPLQGTPVIGKALRLIDPDPAVISVTMVGRGQDYAMTRDIAGDLRAVKWVDWVDGEKLPPLVAEHDVCLGIFSGNPKGMRVVPNKVYQGAAAGCAIVTSGSEAQRQALREAAAYVAPDDPEDLAATLRNLAAHSSRVSALRLAAYRRAAQAFTSEAVVQPLHQALTERHP